MISGNHASKNCFDPRSSGKMEISRLDVCRSLVHRTSVLYFAVKRHHLFHLLLYEVFGFFCHFMSMIGIDLGTSLRLTQCSITELSSLIQHRVKALDLNDLKISAAN